MSENISRRDFLKLAGMGTAAVLTGCGPVSRYVTRQAYAEMPEYNQTGVSTTYATTCRECSAGCGLLVRVFEGRAVGVSGNPVHPVNQGKLCSRGITSLQGLYNPDRVQGPVWQNRGNTPKPIDWETAADVIKTALAEPEGTAFLLGMDSDHLYDFANELTASIGAPRPMRYDAYACFEARTTLAEACLQVLGVEALPFFDVGGADVVFSFGANFLETWLSPLAYSRGYSQFRQGDLGQRGHMVQFEARRSLTAAAADEWIPLRPGSDHVVALALGRMVADLRGAEMPAVFAKADAVQAAEQAGISLEQLNGLASRFASAGKVLAIPGGGALGHANGAATARAILALNVLVGNIGQPGGLLFSFAEDTSATLENLSALVDAMHQGKVKVLFIHGVNPVFELPNTLGFQEALQNVPTVISFATYPDETALASTYILPDHSPLEGWGYQRNPVGSDREMMTSAQPVVVPLYDTRSSIDVFLRAAQLTGGSLAEKINYSDEVDFLQKKLLPLLERKDGTFTAPEVLTFWSKYLQYGGWWQKQSSMKAPKLVDQVTWPDNVQSEPPAAAEGQLHLLTYPTQMGDGRGANRPWLQETPDPMTTVMWNSWVEIHPDTAGKLGVTDDDIVRIESDSGSIEAAVYRYPAIRPDCIAVPFGQGHTAMGRYAEGRGSNPAKVLNLLYNESGDLAFGDTLVRVTPTGKKKTQLARFESKRGVYGEH
jgi:anaerobic selenocysteine-containing dehydrogenase